jgi:peroxiredoxin
MAGMHHDHMDAPPMPYATSIEALEPDFKDLLGTDGGRYSLDSFKEARVLVVIFAGNGCPTTRALEPWWMRLQSEYEAQGVQIVLINANNASLSPPDTYEELLKHVERHPLPFPYLKDEDRSTAMSFGATNTPEAFVLDEARHVRYRGRPADARRPSAITIPYMKLAVDDLLAGRGLQTPETEPYGCAIIW